MICAVANALYSNVAVVVPQDYIPHNLSDFAEALANPIKFQSEQEKRTVQLAVYSVEDAALDDDCANSCKWCANL